MRVSAGDPLWHQQPRAGPGGLHRGQEPLRPLVRRLHVRPDGLLHGPGGTDADPRHPPSDQPHGGIRRRLHGHQRTGAGPDRHRLRRVAAGHQPGGLRAQRLHPAERPVHQPGRRTGAAHRRPDLLGGGGHLLYRGRGSPEKAAEPPPAQQDRPAPGAGGGAGGPGAAAG